MRKCAILVMVVLCGVCSAIPANNASASAAAAVSSASSLTSKKLDSGKGALGDAITGKDENDFNESLAEGPGLPLSSAILLSSHHGHHVCLPDVIAYSLLMNHGYPIENLLSLHPTSPQKFQQEVQFLKAFSKAGQHVWKEITSGHTKQAIHALEGFSKVPGMVPTDVNAISKAVTGTKA